MHLRFYLADQNPHRDRTRGVTSYTDGLIRTLVRRDGILVDTVTSRSSYRAPDVPSFRLPFSTDHFAGRLVADHGAHAWAPGQPTLWHFPKGYLGALFRPREPIVATVHDMILAHNAEHYPSSRSRAAFAYWLALTAHSLRTANHVITVSEHARGQIERFALERRIRLPEITVTYQGARWEELAGTKARDKSDYVLHLASSEPHKRTETLLAHWASLQTRGERVPRLLVLGDLPAAAARLATDCQGISVQANSGADALGELMEHALALVIPSEIEGFGVPALEAYYRGTPVVFVRGTAVEEVLGGTEGAFDIEDASELARAITVAAALEPETIAQTALGLRERFSWAACTQRTLCAYERLV